MSCPSCKAALLGDERYCDNCSVGLSWSGGAVAMKVPEILPGERLVSQAFSTSPLPGRPSRDEVRAGVCEMRGVPEGVLVTNKVASTGAYTDLGRSFTDACVRTTFTPYDAGTRLGLSARHALIGGSQLYYSLDLSLPAGTFWLSRNFQQPGYATSETVGQARTLPRCPPLGVPITLELRAQGPSLRGLVNGETVLVVHDPTFTCGGFGIRCGREPDIPHDVRVLCHGYEIRGVTA